MKKYNVLGGIPGDLLPVKVGEHYGYINHTSSLVIPAKYDMAYPFYDGFAAVSLNGKYGYINTKGKTVIPFLYQDAGMYSEGYAPVKKYGVWGYINKKGKVLIEFIFEDAHEFSEGLASVKSSGKYHFINPDGNVALADRYTWAGSFTSGIALVQKENGYAFIDSGGKILLDKLDYTLVKDYRTSYPYSTIDPLELYSSLRDTSEIKVNPEALILIQEAKLHKGFIAELANLLEITIKQKNDCIVKKEHNAAATLRSTEVKLLSEIKKLLKRD